MRTTALTQPRVCSFHDDDDDDDDDDTRYRVIRDAELAYRRAGDSELKLACRHGAVAALRRSLAQTGDDGVCDEDVAAALQVACAYVTCAGHNIYLRPQPSCNLTGGTSYSTII